MPDGIVRSVHGIEIADRRGKVGVAKDPTDSKKKPPKAQDPARLGAMSDVQLINLPPGTEQRGVKFLGYANGKPVYRITKTEGEEFRRGLEAGGAQVVGGGRAPLPQATPEQVRQMMLASPTGEGLYGAEITPEKAKILLRKQEVERGIPTKPKRDEIVENMVRDFMPGTEENRLLRNIYEQPDLRKRLGISDIALNAAIRRAAETNRPSDIRMVLSFVDRTQIPAFDPADPASRMSMTAISQEISRLRASRNPKDQQKAVDLQVKLAMRAEQERASDEKAVQAAQERQKGLQSAEERARMGIESREQVAAAGREASWTRTRAVLQGQMDRLDKSLVEAKIRQDDRQVIDLEKQRRQLEADMKELEYAWTSRREIVGIQEAGKERRQAVGVDARSQLAQENFERKRILLRDQGEIRRDLANLDSELRRQESEFRDQLPTAVLRRLQVMANMEGDFILPQDLENEPAWREVMNGLQITDPVQQSHFMLLMKRRATQNEVEDRRTSQKHQWLESHYQRQADLGNDLKLDRALKQKERIFRMTMDAWEARRKEDAPLIDPYQYASLYARMYDSYVRSGRGSQVDKIPGQLARVIEAAEADYRRRVPTPRIAPGMSEVEGMDAILDAQVIGFLREIGQPSTPESVRKVKETPELLGEVRKWAENILMPPGMGEIESPPPSPPSTQPSVVGTAGVAPASGRAQATYPSEEQILRAFQGR